LWVRDGPTNRDVVRIENSSPIFGHPIDHPLLGPRKAQGRVDSLYTGELFGISRRRAVRTRVESYRVEVVGIVVARRALGAHDCLEYLRVGSGQSQLLIGRVLAYGPRRG
jgi:hypothetical protein